MRYNTVEVCRGIAAALVVASHASGTTTHFFGQEPFGGYFGVGYTGVDFFFVLSGFIIATVHADDAGRPRRFCAFFWKRFTRIFPTYWIILSILIAAHFLIPSIGTAQHRTASAMLKSIVLWPNSSASYILSVAWTLSYELLFYAIFSIAILNKSLGYSAFLFWQVAVLFANLNGNPTVYALNLINLEFLLGVSVAWLPIWKHGKWCTPIGAVGFLIAAAATAQHVAAMQTRVSVFAFGGCSALIVYGLKCLERHSFTMPTLPMLIGASSYSIYLVHYPVVSLLVRALHQFPKLPVEITFLLLVVVGCGAGIVFHKIAESPIHHFLRRVNQQDDTPIKEKHLTQHAT